MAQDYTQRNFSIKAVILSILLAALLAASNVYLALKIGTTISASIPAAVISIGIFRLFRHYSVFECNLVQTAASAGEGMAAAASFVLPGMIIFHLWGHFDYWISMLTICLGGAFGVFLSVPLRRILLSLPELKYPEGTAIGNVLKVSASKSKGLLKNLLTGVVGGGLVSFLQQGLQVATSLIPLWVKSRGMLFGITVGFNPAAFAAGFIVGPEVALSLFFGLIMGWVILIPILCHLYGLPAADNSYDAVMTLWSHYLRFVGVGTLLVGGLWTMVKLIKPIVQGVKISLMMLGKKELIAEHEKDIPMLALAMGGLVFMGLILIVLAYIFNHLQMGLSFKFTLAALIITFFFIMITGFLVTTICGYVAGVIGSTNNPLSGMVIIAVLLLGLIYVGLFDFHQAGNIPQVVGLILMVATIVCAIASIGSENFQDLKAGRMIGAAPWKQQLMLVIGVVVASLVVAPILQLLYSAYGMGGVFPHAGMNSAEMLPAMQASLMGTVATGIITHQILWTPVLVGVAIALVVVLFDLTICRRYWKYRLSVLGFGMSIYLPPELMTAIIFGGFMHFVLRRVVTKRFATHAQQDKAMENANLGACGIVAGSSLMGVILAVPFAIAGNTNVLMPAFAGNPHFVWLIDLIGVAIFAAVVRMLFTYIKREK